MRAFRHAVDLGYTHVETDVHATADGVAVAFHDDSLDRVTDGRGVVGDLSWSQVRRALVAGTDPILRLDELLEALPDTRINIDPKSDAAVGPLVEVLRRTGAVERVCVCSFSDRRTRQVRDAIGAALCVGAGPRGIARLLAASAHLPGPASFDFHAAQVPVRSKGLTHCAARGAGRGPPPRCRSARLDHRRARRDAPPPRHGGGRHHDRPALGAAPGDDRAGLLGGVNRLPVALSTAPERRRTVIELCITRPRLGISGYCSGFRWGFRVFGLTTRREPPKIPSVRSEQRQKHRTGSRGPRPEAAERSG